ncbi:MAG: c-type cytochrome biogenesis protein CcsB [Actinomycetota bacterium]
MTVNESLAESANILLYGSMAAYAGAFLAYTADLASSTARLGVTRSAQPDEQKVNVGSAQSPVDIGSPSPDMSDHAGRAPEQLHRGLKNLDSPARNLADQEPARRAAAIGTALTVVAALLHVGSVVTRGVAVERPPWSNMFEFSTAGAWVVTAVFLAAFRWRDVRYLGAFVIGPVLLTLGLAVAVLYTEAGQVVPALRSVWLAIHVSVAFIASALFVIAFSLTVLYLVQQRRQERRDAGEVVEPSFMDSLPSATELDTASYRLHAIGFPLWTFTVIAGAIWAEQAWGRYWGWDPKEVWSFVIWVVYAGYLHARATRGWQGRKAAWLAMVGFGCLLFNFLVVNIVFVGWHSYAGVG